MTPLLMAAFLVGVDPGGDVLAVFSARCAHCHERRTLTQKTLGGIDYILDIKRVAANKEIVVPSDLPHSNMWLLVNAGNMPPPSSPTGPLTQPQKDLIKAWISAGCPVPLAATVPPPEKPATTTAPGQADDSPGEPLVADTGRLGASFLTRTVDWLGNFHLLILHFPIALVVLAAGGEGLGWWLARRPAPAGPIMASVMQLGVTVLVALATVAAVPTVALGWLHAYGGSGSSQPDNLFWHSWLGTGSLVLLAGTAWLCWGDAVARTRRLLTRVLIFGSALVVGVVGHFGGMMVHGRNFLSW